LYAGLGNAFNQQYWLWNAAIGYRMLKNDALEANSILNYNQVLCFLQTFPIFA